MQPLSDFQLRGGRRVRRRRCRYGAGRSIPGNRASHASDVKRGRAHVVQNKSDPAKQMYGSSGTCRYRAPCISLARGAIFGLLGCILGAYVRRVWASAGSTTTLLTFCMQARTKTKVQRAGRWYHRSESRLSRRQFNAVRGPTSPPPRRAATDSGSSCCA